MNKVARKAVQINQTATLQRMEIFNLNLCFYSMKHLLTTRGSTIDALTTG